MFSKKTQRNVFGFLSKWLAPVVLNTIYTTSSIAIQNERFHDELEQNDTNYILGFWHGQMLPLLSFFRGKGLYTFISPHRDGEYIARALRAMGNHCVRTSLRDRRIRALGRAIKLIRNGESLAVTPDGPIGPRFKVKPGIIRLSEKVEIPILPAVGLPSRAIYFSSWDRFCLPLPLTTIHIHFSQPLEFWNTSLSMDEKQTKLQDELNRRTRELSDTIGLNDSDYLQEEQPCD